MYKECCIQTVKEKFQKAVLKYFLLSTVQYESSPLQWVPCTVREHWMKRTDFKGDTLELSKFLFQIIENEIIL